MVVDNDNNDNSSNNDNNNGKYEDDNGNNNDNTKNNENNDNNKNNENNNENDEWMCNLFRSNTFWLFQDLTQALDLSRINEYIWDSVYIIPGLKQHEYDFWSLEMSNIFLAQTSSHLNIVKSSKMVKNTLLMILLSMICCTKVRFR